MVRSQNVFSFFGNALLLISKVPKLVSITNCASVGVYAAGYGCAHRYPFECVALHVPL